MREKRHGLQWIFFVGFILGILIANVIGKTRMEQIGILNQFYLDQYQYANINHEELFWYLVKERTGTFAILLLLGISILNIVVFWIYATWVGFALGMVYAAAVMNYGIKGLLLVSTALFPHYLLYAGVFFAQYYLIKQFRTSRQTRYWKYGMALLVLLLVCCLGIVAETYCNPAIMQKILKFF